MKKITTIQEFAEAVTGTEGLFAGNEIREGMSFRIIEKHVNNDGTIIGVCIRKEDNNVAPNIYLDPFFEEFNDKGADNEAMRVVLEKMENIYLEATENQPEFDVSRFSDFEWIKGLISAKLVNTKANEKWLEEVANVPYGDLSVVFMVKISAQGTVTVRKEMLSLWNTTEAELMSIATSNVTEDIVARNMAEVLKDLIGIEELEGMDLLGPCPMTVVTNSSAFYGASALISKEFLQSFADENGSYWIIPSSVHEIIFVPATEGTSNDELSAMVNEVNSTDVSPEERLSNTVYYYDAEKGELQYGETKVCIA